MAIEKEIERFRKRGDNNMIIRRFSLYLNEETKASSLALRVAAVISSNEIEEFEFDDQDISAIVEYAEQNYDCRIRIPSQYLGRQYEEIMRTQIYDD